MGVLYGLIPSNGDESVTDLDDAYILWTASGWEVKDKGKEKERKKTCFSFSTLQGGHYKVTQTYVRMKLCQLIIWKPVLHCITVCFLSILAFCLLGLEILTEVIPCGIDPIGVFVVHHEDNVDEHRIQNLVQQLPVSDFLRMFPSGKLLKIYVQLSINFNYSSVCGMVIIAHLWLLQESFLESSDAIVLTRCSSASSVKAFVLQEGDLCHVPLETRSEVEVEAACQVVRVKGAMVVVAPKTQVDIESAFKHLMEKVRITNGMYEGAHGPIVLERMKLSGALCRIIAQHSTEPSCLSQQLIAV